MASRRRQFGYQLHESTRRSFCRLAVVLFGFVPLLLTVFYCGLQFSPGYQRAQAASWETWLSSQLGVTTKIAAVESKSPQHFALHDVQFINAESQASIGRIQTVDIQLDRGQWTVRLTAPEIEGKQFQATWKTLHDWFLCQPALHSRAARLVTEELQIRSSSGNTSLTRVSAKLIPKEKSVWLAVNFDVAQRGSQQAGESTTEPQAATAENPGAQLNPPSQAMFIVKRNHEQLATDIQLRAESPIPGAFLASILPQIEQLGEAVCFSGIVGLQIQQGAWHLELSDASFQMVDFGVLTRNTEATVSGLGDIFINRARAQHNRIDFAVGSVMIQSGRINGPFLQAIGRHLDVELRVSNSVASHAFDSAKFSVCIQPNGFKLAGQLPGSSIINDQLGSLASRSAEKWDSKILSLESLVHVLDAPTGDSGQPQTRLARNALLLLPIEAPPRRSANSLRLSRTYR